VPRKVHGWSFKESAGICVSAGPRPTGVESKKLDRKAEEFRREGDRTISVSRERAMLPGEDVYCPNGCPEGIEMRTFYHSSTCMAWFSDYAHDSPEHQAQDPNTHALDFRCCRCSRRFLKTWVPADTFVRFRALPARPDDGEYGDG